MASPRKASASGHLLANGLGTSENGFSSCADSTNKSTRREIEATAKRANGRHRRDGSRPSGNTNATASGQAKKNGHCDATSAAQEPPGSELGCASSATNPYVCAASTVASDSAPRTSIHPIGLRGR